MTGASGNILEIKDLHVHFFVPGGIVQAVNGVNIELREGEAVGIVGESGCGKTMTPFRSCGLSRSRRGEFPGEIRFEGEDLRASGKGDAPDPGEPDLHDLPGPDDLLNPCYTVGNHLNEVFRLHRRELARKEIWTGA